MKSSDANESVSPARAGTKSVTVRGRVKILEYGQEKPVKRSAASKKLEVRRSRSQSHRVSCHQSWVAVRSHWEGQN